MKPPIPITDSRFAYIPSANHDADSEPFRARQRSRIAAADAARKANAAEAQSKVKQINRSKA